MSKKRFTSVAALCLFFMIVIAACGGGGNEPAANNASSSGNTDAYDWSAKERITISLAEQGGGPLDDEWGVAKDPVSLMLNEKFNIEMFLVDASDSGDYNTARFAGMAAAGDLPDIFRVPDGQTLTLLMEANSLLELSQYFSPELTPNILKDNQMKAAIMVHQKGNNWGDKVYNIPMSKGTHDAIGPLVGDYIRWDLYKELGYPDVKSPDQLIDVLKRMQDLRPENHEGRKAYAVSGWFGDGQGWGEWALMYYRGFNNGRGDLGPYPFLVSYNKETLELYPDNQMLSDDGNFWSTLYFFNQAYQKGILDPEAFIQGYGEWEDKLKNGLTYHFIPGWVIGGIQNAFNELGYPEWGFGHTPGVNSDVQSLQNIMTGGERPLYVSAKTKDPERVMALLDYMSTYEFATIGFNGIPGVYWDYDQNGVPTPNADYWDKSIEDTEKKRNSGMRIYMHATGWGNGSIDPKTGVTVNLQYHPLTLEADMSIVSKDVMQHYGGRSLMEAYSSQLKVYQTMNPYAAPTLPEELLFDQSNMLDYVFKNCFNVIRAESNAEFNQMKEQFREDLKQFKMDEMFNFIYDAVKDQEDFAKDVFNTWSTPGS